MRPIPAHIMDVSFVHHPSFRWSSLHEGVLINYQRGVLLVSVGAIEGHFEGKTSREGQQGGLVLALQCPGSPGTCNPEESGLPGPPLS